MNNSFDTKDFIESQPLFWHDHEPGNFIFVLRVSNEVNKSEPKSVILNKVLCSIDKALEWFPLIYLFSCLCNKTHIS